MSDTPPTKLEAQQLWWLAVAVAVVLVVLSDLPSWRRGPTAEEILSGVVQSYGRLPWWQVALPSALAAAAGAVAAAGALMWPASRRPGGAFSVVAAAALASSAVCLWWHHAVVLGVVPWGGPVLIAVLAAAVAPLLRDRGLISLALVSLAIGLVTVSARRQAIGDCEGARQLGGVRQAVINAAVQPLFASVEPELPLVVRQGLARSLRPPFEPVVDLAIIEGGTVEEHLLLQTGWPGVRVEGHRAEAIPAAPQVAVEPFPFQVNGRWLEQRGPVAVIDPPQGRFTLRVLTPAGAVRQFGENPDRGLRLVGDAWQGFAALVAPFPQGTPVWLHVEREGTPGGSGWQRLELRR